MHEAKDQQWHFEHEKVEGIISIPPNPINEEDKFDIPADSALHELCLEKPLGRAPFSEAPPSKVPCWISLLVG